MPSFGHQAIVDLFRFRVTLAAEIVERVLGVRLPAFTRVSLRETDLGELVPTDHRADLVAVLEGTPGEPVAGIIVEVQLSRDPDKPFVWPLYHAGLRARLRCPCCVLVVTPTPAVARWASRPVDTGQPGAPFQPLVLGPRLVPRLVSLDAARANPELAVLSVLAHGRTRHGPAVLEPAAQAATELHGVQSVVYLEAMWCAVGADLRQKLEAQMKVGEYEFENEAFGRVAQKLLDAEQRGLEMGKVEGKIDAVLRNLRGRGIRVNAAQRERIGQCADLDTLDRWLDLSLTVDSADALFH